MYYISKKFSFSAAHHLHKLPASHPCSRQHGHNYTIEVVLQGKDLSPMNWLVDYGELSKIVNPIIAELDHQDLNIVLLRHLRTFNLSTTAEVLAKYFFDKLKSQFDPWAQVFYVKVSETEKTWAIYKEVGDGHSLDS